MRAAVMLVLLGLVAASGCTKVAAWERSQLARPDMLLGHDAALQFGEAHARAYREAAIGGGEVVAGGCGCN